MDFQTKLYKTLTLFTLFIVLLSCNKQKESFVINGTIDQISNGSLSKLIKIENNKPLTIDSFYVKNGTIKFEGFVEHPDLYYISINSVKNSLPLMVENETINITFDSSSIFDSKIEGSEENDLFKDYQNFTKQIRSQAAKILKEKTIAQSNNSTYEIQSLKKSYDSLIEVNNIHDLNFIEKNNKNVISAILLERLFKAKEINDSTLEFLHTNFNDKVKNSRPAKYIDNYLSRVEANQKGNIIENFEAFNLNKELFSLEDLDNDLTLISFWGSWCDECREKTKEFRYLNNKYSSKNLKIISYSLDRPNSEYKWRKIVEQDSMKWINVSKLEFWNDPIVNKYAIRDLPLTILIDNNKKILGKNLPIDSLELLIKKELDIK